MSSEVDVSRIVPPPPTEHEMADLRNMAKAVVMLRKAGALMAGVSRFDAKIIWDESVGIQNDLKKRIADIEQHKRYRGKTLTDEQLADLVLKDMETLIAEVADMEVVDGELVPKERKQTDEE